jgi:hypothetical protein
MPVVDEDSAEGEEAFAEIDDKAACVFNRAKISLSSQILLITRQNKKIARYRKVVLVLIMGHFLT